MAPVHDSRVHGHWRSGCPYWDSNVASLRWQGYMQLFKSLLALSVAQRIVFLILLLMHVM